LRVLHYIDVLRLEAGGVVRAVLDLTAELARAGAQVTLATGDATDAPPEWREDPTAPRVVTLDRSLNVLLRPKTAGPELRRLAETHDIVHLHTPWDPFNPAVANAARAARKPYVVSIHGMLDDWCMAGKPVKKNVFLTLFGRQLLQRAAWVHFTASIEAEQSMRHCPAATPLVEPLVVDATPFRNLVGASPAREAFPHAFTGDGVPRLLFLGRVHPIKGLPTLLEAIALLPAAQRPHLLLAGPAAEGHDVQLQRQAAALGVADRLHFLGMVGGDRKQSLYQAADAFVLPSHHENFGIALVEAMMCGAPVLTSRSVNIWPEVEKLGGIVADHSPEGFADGLRQLLKDLPAHQQAAAMNRPAVFEWLEPKRLATRYLEAYDRAISAT
jgi:glycosyltransferase involved in cell wall biosynthesis